MRTLGGFDGFVDAADFSGKIFGNSGSSGLGVISFPNWGKFPEFLKIIFREFGKLTKCERNSQKYFQEFENNPLVRIGPLKLVQ